MADSTVSAESMPPPSEHNFSSLRLKWNEVIQPKCKSPSQSCGMTSRNLVQQSREGVSSPNNCSMTPKKKKKRVDEFEDQSKDLVSSCNQEDKKKISSLKSFIRLPPTEKKIAQEDEKQIANLVDEKPVARTWNFRLRRKTNSKYASSVLEENHPDTFEEFTNSLTREEIEEDYIYLMGKLPQRTKKKRVR